MFSSDLGICDNSVMRWIDSLENEYLLVLPKTSILRNTYKQRLDPLSRSDNCLISWSVVLPHEHVHGVVTKAVSNFSFYAVTSCFVSWSSTTEDEAVASCSVESASVNINNAVKSRWRDPWRREPSQFIEGLHGGTQYCYGPRCRQDMWTTTTLMSSPHAHTSHIVLSKPPELARCGFRF